MTDDEIEGLLGGQPPLPDTNELEKRRLIRAVAGGRGTFVDAGELKRPVTTNFLAQVFDMDPATVKKRLLRVKPIGMGGTENAPRPVYEFKEAVSYLVEPQIDLDEYIRSLDPNRLPNHINKVFWEAKRTRLRYELEAGKAWADEDVLDVLGIVFMLIKNRIPLITENMRDLKLADTQLDKLQTMLEAFQSNLHKELVELPRNRQTLSKAFVVDDAPVEEVEAVEAGET